MTIDIDRARGDLALAHRPDARLPTLLRQALDELEEARHEVIVHDQDRRLLLDNIEEQRLVINLLHERAAKREAGWEQLHAHWKEKEAEFGAWIMSAADACAGAREEERHRWANLLLRRVRICSTAMEAIPRSVDYWRGRRDEARVAIGNLIDNREPP